MKRQMLPVERIECTISGEDVDRLPVINPVSVITTECMEITNIYFPEAHLNYEKMAKLAACGHEIFGFDSIAPYFSVHQEAAVFREVNWGDKDKMPYLQGAPYKSIENIVIPQNLNDKKPLKTVLKAIELLKEYYGDKACIIGKVMGPWTLAYHLFGVENFLIKTLSNPEEVNEILDKLKEISIEFGEAQYERGADFLTIADHATGDLISPESYIKFLKPVHKEINMRLHGKTILHICGKNLDRIREYSEAGFDIYHFESKNDANKAKSLVGESLILAGNINNPEILLNGTPEDVRKQVFNTANAGVDIISPECAVPLQTPMKNLRTIIEAVKNYCGIRF